MGSNYPRISFIKNMEGSQHNSNNANTHRHSQASTGRNLTHTIAIKEIN